MRVRVEQLGSPWTDFFNEILNLSIFRKYVDKIPVSLNSAKNNERFTCRQIHILTCQRLIFRWYREPATENVTSPQVSPHRKSSHATMVAETGNHYRYGNGNMADQTTTWPLSNHSDFIYSHFLITY